MKGGDRVTSRLLWRQLAETAENEDARRAALLKLMQLDALEQIEQLQAAVDRLAARTSQPVSSWSDVVRAGILRGVPQDPTGTPYELRAPGTVTVSQHSRLFPLPIEPGASTRP